jgi:hypothetical protein
MATPLPTVSVTDDQLALLLEVFGTAQGYTDWLVPAIKAEVRRRKQAEVQAQYRAALESLNQQEAAAMAAIDSRLASVAGG